MDIYDTDHSYAVTREELQAYKGKIKPGGIIAGHDYIQGNWGEILRYGVIEAVHEFCVQEDWELIFQTMEMSNSPSFEIRHVLSLKKENNFLGKRKTINE